MYDWIYDWFRRINAQGNRLVAFVIMPNHLHFMLHVPTDHSINRLSPRRVTPPKNNWFKYKALGGPCGIFNFRRVLYTIRA
jgi:hypothetical protein